MKKIAFHIDNLAGGGTERVLLTLSKGLVQKGYSVDLVLMEAKGEFVENIDFECNIIEIGNNIFNIAGLRGVHKVIRLANYIRKKKPDCIISALGGPNTRLILSKLLTRTRTLFIVSVHNHWSSFAQSSSYIAQILRRIRYQILYSVPDKIVAVSHGVASDLIDTFSLRKEKIYVIYNPNDIDEIVSKSEETIDDPWFINKQIPIVIACGRLAAVKRYDELVRAFSIARKRRELRLLILGEGIQRSNLLKLIKSLNLEMDIRLTGYVANPWNYMKNSDLLVISSKSESFSCVIVEAMACGCPVVSTACVGPFEILEQGKWGKIVPVGDIEVLAEAMLETLDKPIQPALLINRAEDFSAEKSLDSYIQLIKTSHC